ncbi:hypothetical protein BPNPMPFG_005437 [Mesorhizobium sp. AR07]|uniref:hypothetical protein n=1 Tax=Mesorhizobium sp. AR07 TaxID=2865838 RepID=UPI002160CA6F|nr:hypothetical protein [Mesorhizobium sp. AR07]UVK43628.1 hypothetical protein BPNPMPFG_005437 [Mesorhizobium sp. AR07]
MSSSSKRVAQLRRKRIAQGLGQVSVWLAPGDKQMISAVIQREGLNNQSEAIRYALSKVSDALPDEPAGDLERRPAGVDR